MAFGTRGNQNVPSTSTSLDPVNLCLDVKLTYFLTKEGQSCFGDSLILMH